MSFWMILKIILCLIRQLNIKNWQLTCNHNCCNVFQYVPYEFFRILRNIPHLNQWSCHLFHDQIYFYESLLITKTKFSCINLNLTTAHLFQNPNYSSTNFLFFLISTDTTTAIWYPEYIMYTFFTLPKLKRIYINQWSVMRCQMIKFL